MSEELISKKDLLELTNISYGQLYRWKRKNLIPEEWFIRKSTFTGQETFFPKEKILERIEKIQTMKENLSLDELANVFSPNLAELSLEEDEIIRKGIASQAVLNIFLEINQGIKKFTFEYILSVYILEKLLVSGEINLDEGKMVLQVLNDHYRSMKSGELFFIRKLGMSSCFIVSGVEDINFEKSTKVVTRVSLTSCMEELTTKLL
ncbi:YhbD family protein [Bacillus sp. FJAT-49736]|uniref:YhbD family protein n=1 Tax=Bacillus sp. FJAT-49736 TaxID=2833582 RepID=UPI001BCA1B5D|nr:YhbD family protein [Bacillus sp. FJAT-49736]MBS4175454.1 YhbD family protein [Bacillus sp. FJAT-49736]